MKTLVLAAAAALLLTGAGVGTANADPYRHERHGYHHHGPGVWIGDGGVRIVPARRHHDRHCWLERRIARDRHGHRHTYTVRVCR
jgi:hypothetical protein